MLLFVNSMPKSGSSSYFYCALSMLENTSSSTGMPHLYKSIENNIIEGFGYFVYSRPNECLSLETLNKLASISSSHGDIIIKIHSDINPALEEALLKLNAKIVFLIRDPRDVVLSAMDHASRSKVEGNNEFIDCLTIDGAVAMSTYWSEVAVRWLSSNSSLVVRYEDFVASKTHEMKRLAAYLNFSTDVDFLSHVKCGSNENMPFSANRINKGIGSRWRLDKHSAYLESLPTLSQLATNLGYA
jgi:hypothetical protein